MISISSREFTMITFISLIVPALAAVIPPAVSPVAPFSAALPAPAPVQTSTTNLTNIPKLDCPFDIKGQFEFPHLIIPTNKDDPQQAPGTAYWAEMTSKVS